MKNEYFNPMFFKTQKSKIVITIYTFTAACGDSSSSTTQEGNLHRSCMELSTLQHGGVFPGEDYHTEIGGAFDLLQRELGNETRAYSSFESFKPLSATTLRQKPETKFFCRDSGFGENVENLYDCKCLLKGKFVRHEDCPTCRDLFFDRTGCVRVDGDVVVVELARKGSERSSLSLEEKTKSKSVSWALGVDQSEKSKSQKSVKDTTLDIISVDASDEDSDSLKTQTSYDSEKYSPVSSGAFEDRLDCQNFEDLRSIGDNVSSQSQGASESKVCRKLKRSSSFRRRMSTSIADVDSDEDEPFLKSQASSDLVYRDPGYRKYKKNSQGVKKGLRPKTKLQRSLDRKISGTTAEELDLGETSAKQECTGNVEELDRNCQIQEFFDTEAQQKFDEGIIYYDSNDEEKYSPFKNNSHLENGIKIYPKYETNVYDLENREFSGIDPAMLDGIRRYKKHPFIRPANVGLRDDGANTGTIKNQSGRKLGRRLGVNKKSKAELKKRKMEIIKEEAWIEVSDLISKGEEATTEDQKLSYAILPAQSENPVKNESKNMKDEYNFLSERKAPLVIFSGTDLEAVDADTYSKLEGPTDFDLENFELDPKYCENPSTFGSDQNEIPCETPVVISSSPDLEPVDCINVNLSKDYENPSTSELVQNEIPCETPVVISSSPDLAIADAATVNLLKDSADLKDCEKQSTSGSIQNENQNEGIKEEKTVEPHDLILIETDSPFKDCVTTPTDDFESSNNTKKRVPFSERAIPKAIIRFKNRAAKRFNRLFRGT